jgi:preprotein translocase subunit SecG
MTFLLYLFYVLFIFICVILMLVILVQKGRGGGLSGAFGGGGGNTAFGSKTGDVLTWATSILFGVFLLLAIALNLIANAYDASHSPKRAAANTSTPAAPTAPIKEGTSPLPQTPPGSTDPGVLPQNPK